MGGKSRISKFKDATLQCFAFPEAAFPRDRYSVCSTTRRTYFTWWAALPQLTWLLGQMLTKTYNRPIHKRECMKTLNFHNQFIIKCSFASTNQKVQASFIAKALVLITINETGEVYCSQSPVCSTPIVLTM